MDLVGKLAIITGANSGIGKEACIQLAQRGCEIVMCCRSIDRAAKAKEEIVSKSGISTEKVHIVQLDLSDLDNVETFRARYDAEKALSKRPIDMLILNAGLVNQKRILTKQNLELMMATNVFGHHKFTAEMLDLCKAAPHCRIVVVSSLAHRVFASTVKLDDLTYEKTFSPMVVYGESKLGNLLFMKKLNRLLEEKGIQNIVVVGCHPGYSITDLGGDSKGSVTRTVEKMFAQTAAMGATPTVLAATDPKAERNGYAGPNGFQELWGPAKWGCFMKLATVDSVKLQEGLWAKCEELTGQAFSKHLS